MIFRRLKRPFGKTGFIVPKKAFSGWKVFLK